MPDLRLVGLMLQEREERLSTFASKSYETKGREIFEDLPGLRTEFQRDRDRIIHCKAFRRIKHKTQVFIAPKGDHYVTRLTHTLEVTQKARTIARALNLNEDLTEAMALGHDIGHPPFGHIGESELGSLCAKGFRHNLQSLRIVDHLEKKGKGLNLTFEVRQGILHHSKPRGDFWGEELPPGLSLEAQILRVADAIAYLDHDLLDSFRGGLLRESDVPLDVREVLGDSHSSRIDSMITDIVATSWGATGLVYNCVNPVISVSEPIRDAANSLREFMFQRVYMPINDGPEGIAARRIIRLLFEYFNENVELIPDDYLEQCDSTEDAAVDYIAGMTDNFAIELSETISHGISEPLKGRLV